MRKYLTLPPLNVGEDTIRHFIFHLCDYCIHDNSLMYPCSGAMTEKCEQERDNYLQEWKANRDNNGKEKQIKMEDWKERFVKEYHDLKDKYDKLDRMTVKYEAGTLDFEPNCSLELLKEQKMYMGNYLRILKIRSEIERIPLEW